MNTSRFAIQYSYAYDTEWSPRYGVPMTMTRWGARRVLRRLQRKDWGDVEQPIFRIIDTQTREVVS